jgi:hypothetical protein
MKEKKIEFSTGSTRSDAVKEIDYCQVPRAGMILIAKRFFFGAIEHGENNWKSGQPRKEILNHMMDHLLKYMEGDKSENHLGAIGWGVCAIAWFDENNIEIDDLKKLGKNKNKQNKNRRGYVS